MQAHSNIRIRREQTALSSPKPAPKIRLHPYSDAEGTMSGLERDVAVQCFSRPYSVIANELENYAKCGVTLIQVSPVQKHCMHIQQWFAVYQPVDGVTLGNSLGSEEDLKELCERAAEYGIGIILDVVLHHTTGCPMCHPDGSKVLTLTWEALYTWKLPNTNRNRFMMTSFGPKQYAEGEDNSEVIEKHAQLLAHLHMTVGCRGFRFDAAKHIRPEDLQRVLKRFRHICCGRMREQEQGLAAGAGADVLAGRSGVRTKAPFLVAEVLDGRPATCHEYTDIVVGREGHGDECACSSSGRWELFAFDFPLTLALASKLADPVGEQPDTFPNAMFAHAMAGGTHRAQCDISSLSHMEHVLPIKAVALADSHDSLQGDSYSFVSTSGHDSDDSEDEHSGAKAILAMCYLLARGEGVPMISYTQLSDARVRAGIRFLRMCTGCGWVVQYVNPWLVIIERSPVGFAVVNASSGWMSCHMKADAFPPAHYTEMAFDFSIVIGEEGGRRRVSNWGGDESGTVAIGGWEVLFVVRSDLLAAAASAV
eukprot:TRINITY_DN7159_c0_g1_i1.p1 TRINITY_DN7159_c0_g1~~TRINITY_DN7159_c0_g1_i1.p1  ORF type:complete len:537 (+),score=167.44 TRINITY_DN7159_c0_g1_i1:49-1659(+)